ncbi:MAG: SDR family NAD(P)-dependent oxidoreductase [Planctomycetia bacterium]|nr:SDR family NAD(P)-dependent oxidoreductase [Planctomycetia bacterium]
MSQPVRPAPVLKGVRLLSLCLNLPGPAALMRCRQMGARCAKLEPPPAAAAPAGASGDPMGQYNPEAYRLMHQGVRVAVADLKTSRGQAALHRELAKTDVLLTSFRPSALSKLGLDWKLLHRQYPALSQVAIVGAPGARAEEPGHDLTYLAEHDLVSGLNLPPTLYADMGGSLATAEAVLQAVLPGMRARRDGLVVSIASIAGKRALPLAGPGYCASKFGAAGLAATVGLEELPHGIRITTIHPGEVDTPILDQRPEPVPAERRKLMVHPEDIAACVVMLAKLPRHVVVPELVITPTYQAFA